MKSKQQLLFFKTTDDFKDWLAQNYNKAQEIWVGYYKKSIKKESISWEESVEAAITFGWIDGIRKSINDESYTIRFTPRKPDSNWSLKNIKTAQILIENEIMQPSGLKAFKNRKPEKSGIYSFERSKTAFSEEFISIFQNNIKAWSFFKTQAPYYKKVTTHWVMSAKQEKTRQKRLNELITDSENQQKIKAMRRSNE